MDQQTPVAVPKATIRPFQAILTSMWEHYNRRFKLFLMLAGIANINLILYIVVHQLNVNFIVSNIITFVISLAGIFFAVWAGLGLVFVISHPEKATTVEQALNQGGAFFFKSFTTGLLVSLWVLLGLILLIIPGIYWSILYGLSTYIVFKEGLANSAALQRSKALVKPVWLTVLWRTLGIGLVFGLVYILVTSVTNLGFTFLPDRLAILGKDIIGAGLNVLVFPFSTILLSIIYEDVTKKA